MVHDVKDRLIEVQAPENRTTKYTYNADDELTSIQFPDGHFRYNNRNAKGQIVQVVEGNNTITFSLSPAGVLQSVTNGNGNTWTMTNDGAGRLESVTDELENEENIGRNAMGAVINMTNADNQDISIQLDEYNMVEGITDEAESPATYIRNKKQQLTSMTAPEENQRTMDVDFRGRITSFTDAGGTYTTTFDYLGATSFEDANGLTSTYSRDVQGNVDGITYSNGEQYTFTNDEEGIPIEMTNSTGTVLTTVNAHSEVISMTDMWGKTISQTHTPLGNPHITLYSNGEQVEQLYDSVGHNIGTILPTGDTIHREVNNLGAEIRRIFPPGIVTTREYDATEHLSELTTTNPAGNIIHQNSLTRDALFNPDDTGMKFNYPDFVIREEQNLIYSGDDAFMGSSTRTTTVDANGNPTTLDIAEQTASMVWMQNNLMDTYQKSGTSIDFDYNAANILVRKTVNGVEYRYTMFLLNGVWRLMEESNSTGLVTRRYYYNAYGEVIAYKDNNGNVRYYHSDAFFNIVALTDDAAKIKNRYGYDYWGDFMKHDGDDDQPFTYQGVFGYMKIDESLFYAWHRFYNAEAHRFLTKDPAYFSSVSLTNSQSLNPYVYVLNNPTTYWDPLGLKPQSTKYSPEWFREQYMKDQEITYYEVDNAINILKIELLDLAYNFSRETFEWLPGGGIGIAIDDYRNYPELYDIEDITVEIIFEFGGAITGKKLANKISKEVTPSVIRLLEKNKHLTVVKNFLEKSSDIHKDVDDTVKQAAEKIIRLYFDKAKEIYKDI